MIKKLAKYLKQLFLGIGPQTQDCVPWGNRNQKMSFEFAPVFSLRTLSKLRQKDVEWESTSQGGGNKNQYFSYRACCSFGVGFWRRGSFTEKWLQKSIKGFPWVLAQILHWICAGQDCACPGREWLLDSCEIIVQMCLVLEDKSEANQPQWRDHAEQLRCSTEPSKLTSTP